MLNRIVLMGRLTRDPELRRTQSGTAVTSFTLAVDRDFKSQFGEKETDFIDIVVWRSTAEFVSKYFTKGRMAVVEGRIQIRDWTDKDGGKRRSAEVIANTAYEATQKQRQIERTIRKLKREQTAYKAAGLEEDAQTVTARIRRLNKEYKVFSEAAGLPLQRERMKVEY